MMDLSELAQIRRERAGKKYILSSGENESLYRDNGWDILEELADAWAIAGLWEQRLTIASPSLIEDRDYRDRLADVRSSLKQCSDYIQSIRARLPADFRRDLIPVERVYYDRD